MYVLETQDRNTCSDGCGTCDSHGMNNVQLQTRSWTFRSMNHTQTTWCSCPFSNWIKYRQISFAIRDEPHWHPLSSNRMALGSICEFPGNHENISTFQNAIVAPHYLILCLLPIINCQCIPWSRGCALPEQQRCAVSPCRAGQPGCCTFAACPATNKVKGAPSLD